MGDKSVAATDEDDFKLHLDVLIRSGERTRAVLYLYGIMLCAILVVFFEYTYFDWQISRFQRINEAYVCHLLGKKPSDPLPVSRDDKSSLDFALDFLLGSPSVDDSKQCISAYRYVQTYYKIPILVGDPPDSLSEKLTYRGLNELLLAWKNQLVRTYTENVSTTVPLVGTRFDKNSGIIVHNSILFCIAGVLFLCLWNENYCFSIIKKFLVNNPRRIDLVRGCRVFSGWRKLSFWYAVFIPAAIAVIQATEDLSLRNFAITRSLLGSRSAIVYSVGEFVTTLLLLWVSWLCFREGRKLDKQLDKPILAASTPSA